MPDPTVRFAAGSPEKPRSSVWKLWVHGSDAYLTTRLLGRVFKLSMHKSGEWISANTSESGAVFAETGSRRHKTWRRPPEFTPGWTQGPSISIPWVSWRDEIPSRETFPPDTEWISGPKRNKRLLFNILFSAAGVTDSVEAVSLPGDRLLDRSLPKANGGAVWLQVRHLELRPEENKGIAEVRLEWPVIEVSSMETLNLAWGLWVTTGQPIGIPLLVEMPLGRRQFAIKSAEGTDATAPAPDD